jgi:hypothetical protein
MRLLNIETPVSRHFIPQILLNVKTFTSIRLATQVMTKASSDLTQSIISQSLPAVTLELPPPPQLVVDAHFDFIFGLAMVTSHRPAFL